MFVCEVWVWAEGCARSWGCVRARGSVWAGESVERVLCVVDCVKEDCWAGASDVWLCSGGWELVSEAGWGEAREDEERGSLSEEAEGVGAVMCDVEGGESVCVWGCEVWAGW